MKNYNSFKQHSVASIKNHFAMDFSNLFPGSQADYQKLNFWMINEFPTLRNSRLGEMSETFFKWSPVWTSTKYWLVEVPDSSKNGLLENST